MKKKVIISIVAIIALIGILGVVLVACNADSYSKKLKKAGYEVASIKADDIKEYGFDPGDIKWVVKGVKGIDSVTVVKFKKQSQAKDAEKEMKDVPFQVLTIERSGAVLIYGTEDGVKAAK